MSEKYKFHNSEGCYFVTITVVNWIDLFTRKELKYIIIDSLKHCQREKGLVIHAWCVMPSHLHLIVRSEKEKLSDILRDFKKFTSKEIVKTIELINESRRRWLLKSFIRAGQDLKRITNFKVWQDGNHPEEMVTNEFMQQKIDYVHNNPVHDEIVDEAEYYWYSSARDYAGKKGLIDVELLG